MNYITLDGQKLAIVPIAGDPDGRSALMTTGAGSSAASPGYVQEAGVQGVTAIGTAGRGCILVVTTAGNVDFTFADGSTLTSVPVAAGLVFLPFSVTNAVASSSSGAVLAQAKGAK